MILMSVTCPDNQWTSKQLRESIRYAVDFECALQQVGGKQVIDRERIEREALKQWLAASVPAGNA